MRQAGPEVGHGLALLGFGQQAKGQEGLGQHVGGGVEEGDRNLG